jgi:ribonucleoside-diphosphate reductase alpha subunit
MSQINPSTGRPLIMNVTKRDGVREDVSFDKITTRVRYLCDGLSIDPISIAQKICSQIYDGVPTSEIDDFIARVSAAKYTDHPDYGTLASRMVVSNQKKLLDTMKLSTFTSRTEMMYQYRQKGRGKERIKLLGDDYFQIVTKNKDFLNNLIDYEKNSLFDYFGYKTMEKGYLYKCDDMCIETPQDMLLRVSIGIHGDNMELVSETYSNMSDKKFTHASPTLFNSGAGNNQLLSCFLLGVEDSLEGIFKSMTDCAMISKRAGGIGVHVSALRANNSMIKGTNGRSSGITPVARTYNQTAELVNQGGKRKGSIALYMEPHHADILDFLQLKLPNGVETKRARDIFPALWVSDLFMQCVKSDGVWYLFSDDDLPTSLTSVWGDDYKRLYDEYVEKKLFRESIPARIIWEAVVKSQTETGTPYIGYKDAVNRKNNQNHYGTIRSSNLCIEINEYSDEKEYACCTLASICLPEFVIHTSIGDTPPESSIDSYVVHSDRTGTYSFNMKELRSIVGIVTRNLDKIIDINEYPVEETRLSNELHRPLGIGVQGLADAFMKCRIAYDSDKAKELNKRIFETMYYAAIDSSNKLAVESGSYPTFTGSPMERGVFQFDMWKVTPSDVYDWNSLRTRVMTTGLRNSLSIALMPTASTSQIMGNSECFEPYQSNIFKRQTLAGSFVVINKYLLQELIQMGVWDITMKNSIIENGGSIQNINNIPEEIRKRYKTIWEMSNKVYIDMAADRGAFVCQSQSMNLWVSNPTMRTLSSMHMYAWTKGLKTGSYYLRSQPAVDAQQFTIDPSIMDIRQETRQKRVMECTDDICVSCSG